MMTEGQRAEKGLHFGKGMGREASMAWGHGQMIYFDCRWNGEVWKAKGWPRVPRSLTRLKIAILMAMLETSIFRHSTDTPVNERLPNEDLSEPVAVWRRWLHPKSTRYLSADRSIKIRSGTQTNNYRMSSNFLRVTFQMGWQCRQINDHLESSSWTLSCAISLSDTGGEVRDGPYPGYHQNSGISQRWPPTPIEERKILSMSTFQLFP